ncbi:sporulation integral membrane protein YtvI [Gracilibacillus kekensis]|uniref:Sporulation integral membrane protein YtvI n=1 Tax=Gracilibacillus kekensis TaxID=1027249 RepID=A0A1M7NPP8_9BACI|nr:sporulation integral membrane protein YtvI [Gracilibacillus kekensis]SHN06018.1 sporulation integral membrane protein YtvI [Gracilibacillus kekensis]
MPNKQMLFRIAYLLLIINLTVIGIYLIIQYLFPFFLACLFATLLLPVIRFIHFHFKVPYVLSCILAILSAILSTTLLLLFAGVELLQGVIYLTKWIPDHLHFLVREVTDNFNEWIHPIIQKVNQYIHNLPSEQHTLIEEQLGEISISLADQVAYLLELLLNWIGIQMANLPGLMTILIFSFLCTFFICKDWDNFYQYLLKTVPISYIKLTSNISRQMKEKVMKYIKAQLMLIFITFIIIIIGLSLFQVKHAFTIAIFLAMVDLLPILGTGIIFIPWSLFLFMTGDTTLAICLFSLYLFVIFLRQLLEPKFVATAIGIHPILTILAIYLGFQLFGVKGIWLGPVILFISKACSEAKLFHIIWQYIKYDNVNADKL